MRELCSVFVISYWLYVSVRSSKEIIIWLVQSQSIETPYKWGEMLSNMILHIWREKFQALHMYIAGLKSLNMK